MKTIRLLIADDHSVVRIGLRAMLHAIPHLELVGEAQNGHEVLAMVESLRPDVVLMDIQMPGLDGVGAARGLAALENPPRILMLTAYEQPAYTTAAAAVGADGLILKSCRPGELVAAIEAVARGEYYFGVEVSASPAVLSLREREIVRLLATGSTTESIASALDISPRAVTMYRDGIAAKLGIDSASALKQWGIEHGLVGATR